MKLHYSINRRNKILLKLSTLMKLLATSVVKLISGSRRINQSYKFDTNIYIKILFTKIKSSITFYN